MPTLKLFASEGAIDEARAVRLLEKLCEALAKVESVDRRTVKAGLIQMKPSLNLDPSLPGFLCLEACVLAGRSPEIKQKIADTLKGVLDEMAGGEGLALTLEVREMDKEYYRS